jgi:glycosyltransferase involved in cell wall biosynthesis
LANRKIKLGVDAKWYFKGPPSGMVVVKNLVDELLTKTHLLDLYLFIDKESIAEARKVFNKEGVTLIPVKANPNLLSNFFLIPYYSNKYLLDIILMQNFVSLLPVKAVNGLYIHDVLFLDFPQYFSRTELLYYKFMRAFAKNADFIIAISNSEKNRLIKHKMGTEKNIHVVHHGISEKYKPLNEYPEDEIKRFDEKYKLPQKYLLYVGRVNIRKNLFNLVKALKFISDKDIPLIIAGKEQFKNSNIVRYLQENNLEERVKFMGHVPQEDLYLIYAKAHIFCFPSYAEGFGLPPLEAMRCGVPAIVSDRTSLPEVCGDAGIYVDPDQPADIAEKINILIEDEYFYAIKSAQSIKQATQFTWQKAGDVLFSTITSYYDSRKNNS